MKKPSNRNVLIIHNALLILALLLYVLGKLLKLRWLMLLTFVIVIGGAIFSRICFVCPYCGKRPRFVIGKYCPHCGGFLFDD